MCAVVVVVCCMLQSVGSVCYSVMLLLRLLLSLLVAGAVDPDAVVGCRCLRLLCVAVIGALVACCCYGVVCWCCGLGVVGCGLLVALVGVDAVVVVYCC